MDVANYEEFARGRLPGLLRYAAALTGDTEQARDIVQEVMVRAFTRWRRISRMDHPDAYLRRMVTNEWTSWRRRWSVRTITVLPDEQLHNLAGDAPDAMTAVSERDALRRALDTLPHRQRAALVLRYYEGLSYEECAQVLDCAEGTVRSACSRGTAALRRAVDLDVGLGPDRGSSVVPPLAWAKDLS
ncbi:MAG TPA: SigE family RNA polymerase sigma factor [Jatrophihabitantaceae bacterium]